MLFGKSYLNQVIDFLTVIVNEISNQIYKIGNGPRNLEAVREAVLKEVDIDYWRNKFAGNNKEDHEFFNSFSLQGVVTAAYAEMWKR